MPFNAFAEKMAKYNATLPTHTDTDVANLQVDSRGRLIVVTDTAAPAEDDKELTTDDLDTGAGTDTQAIVGMALAEDGGHVLVGSANPMPISDNGGSLTVDGTVAATQSGTWSVEQSGAWSVSVSNFPASQTVDDGGGSLTVDNGGTFAVQVDGDALTALQLIDDLVLLEDAAAAGGEAGVQMLAVRQDTLASSVSADGDFASLKVNSLGELYVTGSFDASVDDVFESGTEADAASDSTGDGVVAVTGSFVDMATIAVGAGQTLYITGLDVSGDEQIAYQLIVDDNGTPSEWIRVGAIDGVNSHNKTFPRAIEIAGAADRSVILRARVLQGTSGNAAGAINAYLR